ncbi:unnamed protein product, partial [marine sediment metagenome]
GGVISDSGFTTSLVWAIAKAYDMTLIMATEN